MSRFIISSIVFLCMVVTILVVNPIHLSAEEVVNACVKGNGEIRIVDGLQECKSNETHIFWNVEGPQG